MQQRKIPKIGLALGSGSARGLSHIGVIEQLRKIGIVPDVVTGCSMGALVGASFVQGNLQKFKDWALSIGELDMAKFFNLNAVTSGFINRETAEKIYAKVVGDLNHKIEDSKIPFGCVATDLSKGKEICLTRGRMLDSVLASAAYPGLLAPVSLNNTWLIDGGLTNPVPISLCYEMGADLVIAVNLTSDRIQEFAVLNPNLEHEENANFFDKAVNNLKHNFNLYTSQPKVWDTIANSLNILQIQVARNKLASAPADVLLTPKLPDMSLLDMFKAKEAIQAGAQCVERMEAEILFQIKNF